MGSNSPFELNKQGIESKELHDQSSIGEAWLQVVSPLPAIEGGQIESDTDRRNLAIVGVIVVLSLLILLGRLFSLQVVSGESYAQLAEGNRVSPQTIYAQRGIIYDRNGTPLVENTASFQVMVTPYLLPSDEEERNSLYGKVAEVIDIERNEIKQVAESKGLSYSKQIVVKNKMTYEDSLLFEQELLNPRGFLLEEVPVRTYVKDAGLSHVLGYISRASSNDLESNDYLELNDFIGRSGIEAQYDKELRGINGSKRTEVNSLGHPLRTLAKKSPERGKDIHLTIDIEVQKSLYKAVRENMKANDSPKGAGIAMHPQTGEVLAMVSEPSYDNNLFSGGIDPKIYKKLVNNKNQPLFNKAISATYPTGSTIKPFVAIGGLEEGVITPQTRFNDTGSIRVGGVTFTNFESRAWGNIGIERALAISSNAFFMSVGGGYGNISGLGVNRLTDWYKKFGLGSKTGVDLPSETAGVVPTPAWKQRVLNQPWYGGETYVLSIGQGDLGVSPIQLARAHSALANNGDLFTPYIVKKITDDAQPVKSFKPEVGERVNVSKRSFSVVRNGMKKVVSEGTMSGVGLQDVKVTVAGKSGTAETGDNRDPHALTVGYGPVANPELLVTIVIEEGKLSSLASTPAVKEVFEDYFGLKDSVVRQEAAAQQNNSSQ